MNAVAAAGLSSESVKAEFDEHAAEEQLHMRQVAERIACEQHRELVRFFADKDPTTRTMIESILAKEEEHANDMADLLESHKK